MLSNFPFLYPPLFLILYLSGRPTSLSKTAVVDPAVVALAVDQPSFADPDILRPSHPRTKPFRILLLRCCSDQALFSASSSSLLLSHPLTSDSLLLAALSDSNLRLPIRCCLRCSFIVVAARSGCKFVSWLRL